MGMVQIQPIRVELEREDDSRILASVPDMIAPTIPPVCSLLE